MLRPGVLVLVLVLVLAAVTIQVPLNGPAARAAGAPGASPGITIRLSHSTVRAGAEVTVSGTAPQPLRSVSLQLRTVENGWQDLARTLTGLSGSYRFRAPSWFGVHRLRVVATGTLLSQKAVSATRTLRVRTSYAPKGARSDWAWLFAPGARWDPCRTLTFQVNPEGSYPRSVQDIQSAFREVGRVSGFDFRYAGRALGAVTRGKHGYHPLGIDIVVDWQSPQEEPGLSGRTAGIGGHWVLGGRRFDGYIILDESERLSRATWRQVVAHEIGHVLGLGHARSPEQLMYGTSSSRNLRWGAGDLAGMRRLGPARGCLTQQRAHAEARPREAAGPAAHDARAWVPRTLPDGTGR